MYHNIRYEMVSYKCFIPILLTLMLTVVLSACVSVTSQPRTDFDACYENGDFLCAADFYIKQWGGSEVASKKMPYLPALDTAYSLMAAAKHVESDTFFGLAQNDVNNENTDGYNPKYYEKIMLNTYSGLNLWQNHDFNNARVEFNRAYSNQQSAIRENRKSIAEAEDEIKQKNMQKTLQNLSVQAGSLYSGFKNLEAYKDFANPYASYMSGLYLVLNGRTSSDVENGINYLKRVHSMMPENSFVEQDLQLAEKVAEGKKFTRRVWIVYEQGLSPRIVREKFTVPFYFGSGVKIAAMALPKLVPRDDAYPKMEIVVGTKNKNVSVTSQQIASVDDIMAAEYKERMPAEIAKAIIWMAVNLAVQEGLQSIGDDSSMVRVLGVVSSLFVSQVVNPVQTETWKTLPKTIEIASFDLPRNAEFNMKVGEKIIADKVSIKNDTKYAVVYVRMPTKYAKPSIIVSEFK